MKTPEKLKKGDTIQLVAPAKAIDKNYIDFAVKFWEASGFNVKIGENCLGNHYYFSGTDAERANDFQNAIDDENIKAIVCARGGYGCIRLIDHINWANLINHPKWLVGFSDVTVFHLYLAKLEIASMHATMPLNYRENTQASLDSMLLALKTGESEYNWVSHSKNKTGEAEGELLGGNLAVISSLVGTSIFPNYQGKILFLEEVGEHLYAIDRMFFQLAKNGILDKIKGLIVGGFSNIKDTETPFGKSLEDIILYHFKYRKIPIAFDFPAGHQNNNQALIFGKKAKLTVSAEKNVLLST